MTAVAEKGPPFPKVHERWVDKGTKRAVIIISIGRGERSDVTVTYRYVPGIGRSGMWRRGVTPLQTVTIHDWLRRFVPEPKEKR